MTDSIATYIGLDNLIKYSVIIRNQLKHSPKGGKVKTNFLNDSIVSNVNKNNIQVVNY